MHRACKTLVLTLLPRRRGQYRLRLNLHAASVPPLPRLSGSHRSLSAGSNTSSPGSNPIGGRLAAPPEGANSSPFKLGGPSPANSPSPRGAGALGQGRLVKSAGVGTQRSSLGDAREEGVGLGKHCSQVAAGAALPGALDAIRAARSARYLPPSDEAAAGDDGLAGVEDTTGRGCGTTSVEGCCMGPTVQLDRPPLATAAVTADASFPSLLLTDVFCEGLPKQVIRAGRGTAL